MARVTIEDCIEKSGNHFKVVQIASRRARQLELGAKPKVEKEDDKSVVIALREIAEGKVDETVLRKPVIEKGALQRRDGLMIQPDDLGLAVADTDSYSDINEVEGDDAVQNVAANQAEDSADAPQESDARSEADRT